MAYKATQDVVQRVMPLLNQLATRTIDKARLLQYLSARAGCDWGVLEIVADSEEPGAGPGEAARRFVFRDRINGTEHVLRYPLCLPPELDELVRAEYKRLAADQPLTMMDPKLFTAFYAASHCAICRWRDDEYEPFHRECRFAGYPVNFEPEDPATT